MNPIPRLRQRLADEGAVWTALRSEPAPHVAAVRRALDTDPPAVADLQRAGLAAVAAAFQHWSLPAPTDLRAAAGHFSALPDARDALVGTAMAELAQARDLAGAAEGLELVLDWTWGVLRADPRDLSAVVPPHEADEADGSGRTRRALVAGLGIGLLVSAVLLADPFDWFGGGSKKKGQTRHRGKKAKRGRGRDAGDAAASGVADSPPATREGQK